MDLRPLLKKLQKLHGDDPKMEKLLREVVGDGFTEGYMEGMAETLFRVREKILKGLDAHDYIQDRLKKMRQENLMPLDFDRDA